ncbi:unnamed protein product [Pylaiella littoralis]
MAARLNPTTLGTRGHHGPGSKRMKVLQAADGSRGWANLPRNDAGGGNYSSNWLTGNHSATGPVITVTVPGSTNINVSMNYPRRFSGRNGTSSPPPLQTAAATAVTAARTALATSFPPSIPTALLDAADDEDDEDADSNGGGGGGGGGSCGGDSSPDWNERDESSEEEVASPPPSGGGGHSGHSGKGAKTKIPFMLDPKLWFVVERRAVCTAKQCAYRSEDDHRARRRHYHALCSHVHQNGERKGMRFQHHQLEKVQKHQRAHQVSVKQNNQRSTATKPRSPSMSPVPRGKRGSSTNGQREQTRAIKDANVEAHSPKDWTPELTKRLRNLVDELGPKWAIIAGQIPGKTATACMLHWRVGLNPNHMVKGSGTWTGEEDERLSKLVEIVGMKWSDLARHIPGRIAKQCRERYLNHLDPSLRKDMPWTEDEEALLMRLCFAKQNQWAEICRQLHGRSYNDVKNRFNLIQRRNKRAQGLPTAPPTSSASKMPAVSASDLKPIRRGKGAANGRGGGDAPCESSTSGARGGDDAAAAAAATGVESTSSSSSFASSRAMAAGGWGPAAATATAAASAVATAPTTTAKTASADGGGGGGTRKGRSSSSMPLCVAGDDLGEFGVGGPESASPGSGFAPGGYWHQMVKNESHGRDSDDDSTMSGGRSNPPPSLTIAGGRGRAGVGVV